MAHALSFPTPQAEGGDRRSSVLIQATIPGGQVSNPIAQARAAEVKRWIDQGLSPAEIQHRIKSWPRRRSGS